MQLKRSVKRGKWAIGSQKASLREARVRREYFRGEWDKVVRETGVSDFHDLVYAFKSFEDKVRAPCVCWPQLQGCDTSVVRGAAVPHNHRNTPRSPTRRPWSVKWRRWR